MGDSLPPPLPLRVLVLGDDGLACAGLSAYFQEDPGWVVAGVERPDDLLVENVAHAAPDLVVWDLGWSEEALDRLGEVLPGLPRTMVLIASPGDAEDAWAAGAQAVLLRQSPPARLLAAARAAAAGLWTSDLELKRPQIGRPADSGQPTDPLTPREMEVLQLMADGLPNKSISARLGVSESTAKFHVNAILRKLEAQSRTEAVVRAGRIGLIPL